MRKTKHIGLRIDEGTAMQLIQLAELTGAKPSEIIRIGIEMALKKPADKIKKLTIKK